MKVFKDVMRSAISGPFIAAALIFASVGASAILQPAVAADLAGAKATVDAAKAKGVVGEQADGYLGLVTGSADPTTIQAMQAINAGRAGVYRDTAKKTGVSVEAAAEATGKQLIAKVPPGQYYKPLGGGWTRK